LTSILVSFRGRRAQTQSKASNRWFLSFGGVSHFIINFFLFPLQKFSSEAENSRANIGGRCVDGSSENLNHGSGRCTNELKWAWGMENWRKKQNIAFPYQKTSFVLGEGTSFLAKKNGKT